MPIKERGNKEEKRKVDFPKKKKLIRDRIVIKNPNLENQTWVT